jgi:predicted ATPase
MSSGEQAVQRLKLRRMRVRGFKSLADFDLRFPDDLLILIGANGAGVSIS